MVGRDASAETAGIVTVTQTPRLVGIDRARGLAVLLMVLDHVLVLVSSAVGSSWAIEAVRLTVTRASLPLFGVIAGVMLGRRRAPDVWLLIAAFGCSQLSYLFPFGTGRPDVLILFAVVLTAAPVLLRAPVLLCALGIIQSVTWPLGGSWTGYQPGTIVALVSLGSLFAYFGGDYPVNGRAVSLLPSWLEPVGRHPLGWYVGHFVVLTIVGVFVL